MSEESSRAPGKFTYEVRDGVAVLRMDDGKVNALDREMLSGLRDALRRASGEAGAVLLAGRPGRFSAGFDLRSLGSGVEEAKELVTLGAEGLLDLWLHPRPVVVACTGHALALGALFLLAADVRVGADGAYRIGLNEVAIGLALPLFGVELARDRLSRRHFVRAALLAEVYDPRTAVDAGFLDRLVPEDGVVEEAFGEAKRLAGLPSQAFAETKRRFRGKTAEVLRRTLAEDLSSFRPPS
ncbi:MAG: enoyl-CoA hydratase [Candidatus Binatia bacterium]|nr:MAG: enoyl-CoA hydratase [Candidatus Binatia bacterium]